MKSQTSLDQKLQVLAMLPAFLVGVVFELFLGHRHDYTGHYAAGYGATLIAGLLFLRWWNSNSTSLDYRGLISVVLACIVAGWVTESTIFRFARFDAIDFCSQSLGAVLAGLVLAAWNRQEFSGEMISAGLFIGVVFLGLGAVYAVR